MAMRILLYSSASRLETGGVQRVFAGLVASLRQRGHRVIEAWPGATTGASAGEWVLPLEYRTGPLGLPGPGALLRGGLGLLGLARGLLRFRPEIVNVHYVRGDSLYFLLLRPLFGYRLVLSVHGSDLLRPGAVARRFLGKADAVTVVSQHLHTRVLDCPGVSAARLRLIANGIDHDFWAALEPRPDTPPTLVFVGRLLAVKGVDVLLDAFAHLHTELPTARLVVVGDGELDQALRRQATQLGLQDRVSFTGNLDSLALRALLARSAVFVLPSRSEGLPLALLEAMAVGLPVVASAVGGVPEVLDSSCGRLVAADDPLALAGALIALLGDPRRGELGRAARTRAAAFSSTHADAAYEKLFVELREGTL